MLVPKWFYISLGFITLLGGLIPPNNDALSYIIDAFGLFNIFIGFGLFTPIKEEE